LSANSARRSGSALKAAQVTMVRMTNESLRLCSQLHQGNLRGLMQPTHSPRIEFLKGTGLHERIRRIHRYGKRRPVPELI
jgi:hypothetical protein